MVDKIEGGFVAIPVNSLLRAWRACQGGLGAGAFRAWLAAQEAKARRLYAHNRAPTFTTRELARLCDVSERSVRTSIRKLTSAGLLVFTPSVIEFPAPPEDSLLGGLVAETIGRGRGTMKVPRRLLRFLACGARPALIATAIGSLLRCLSRRRAGWDGRGRVKASWIALAFGVDERAVKAARAELIRLGWLTPEPSDQRAENRWGRAFRVCLSWVAPGRKSPPLPTAERSQIATPSVDPDPLPEREENPEPLPRVQPGACAGGQGGWEPEPSRTEPPAFVEAPVAPIPTPAAPAPIPALLPEPPLPAPILADVRAEDLADLGRLEQLQAQAVQAGLVDASESGRLKTVALAEHCRRIGKNPPALFATLLRRGAWSFITQSEEDAARKRLKESIWAAPSPLWGNRSDSLSERRRPTLSEDARIVREVTRALASAGYRGDGFPQLKRLKPEWTRQRWDLALAELGRVDKFRGI